MKKEELRTFKAVADFDQYKEGDILKVNSNNEVVEIRRTIN